MPLQRGTRRRRRRAPPNGLVRRHLLRRVRCHRERPCRARAEGHIRRQHMPEVPDDDGRGWSRWLTGVGHAQSGVPLASRSLRLPGTVAGPAAARRAVDVGEPGPALIDQRSDRRPRPVHFRASVHLDPASVSMLGSRPVEHVVADPPLMACSPAATPRESRGVRSAGSGDFSTWAVIGGMTRWRSSGGG